MSDWATDRLLEDANNVGRWAAWDREQTRLLATGNTYEEAKLAAAATGERSVTIAKLTSSGPRRKLRWAHAVAVFVAMTPGLGFAASGSSGASDSQTTVSASDLEDELAANSARAEDSTSRPTA